MKKLILVLGIIATLSGCSGGEKHWESIEDYETIIIEDCEYIRHELNGDRNLTHKGNCSNSIHFYRNK